MYFVMATLQVSEDDIVALLRDNWDALDAVSEILSNNTFGEGEYTPIPDLAASSAKAWQAVQEVQDRHYAGAPATEPAVEPEVEPAEAVMVQVPRVKVPEFDFDGEAYRPGAIFYSHENDFKPVVLPPDWDWKRYDGALPAHKTRMLLSTDMLDYVVRPPAFTCTNPRPHFLELRYFHRPYLPACLPACSCLPACLPGCLSTCVPVCLRACLPQCLPPSL